MVVHGKVELIVTVHHVDGIVVAGLDGTCKDVHAAGVMKFPYTGCFFKRDREREISFLLF